jgi:release factor glutamine methyltransferase
VEAAAARLDRAGVPRPRREADRLMAHVLTTDRGGVLVRGPDPLPPKQGAAFEALVERRAQREPLQYLTGEQEFRGLSFRVDHRALIPRPETEELVEALLSLPLLPSARVADLGTGSGCIAVSLALERPGLSVVAVDRSAAALALARDNGARLGARVQWVEADFAALPPSWSASFDAVVSNPPYVSAAEWEGLEPEVRDHEPREALVPGATGLEAYQVLVPAARALLLPRGMLALELGWRSAGAVGEMVRSAGFNAIRVLPDAGGIERILLARAP